MMSKQINKEADWATFIAFTKRFSPFTHEEVQSLKVKIDPLSFTIETSICSEYVKILIERYFKGTVWKIQQGENNAVDV
ncbi:hypothetical protein JWG45_09915 [Leptospira sp. 201903070]|uniref:Uncharacterized protein n=1 Tax=Leptospira ainlahdjerensis TaxID=2810033 RepID=A0ABS2UAS0_9LEPT|nr:hypothetical protein [Leptospira ainlahdjerensis]MBM9577467.1 hypothetical protein [Leptospira ainlahdjerensis]